MQRRIQLKTKTGDWCRTKPEAETAQAVIIAERDAVPGRTLRAPASWQEALAAFLANWAPTVTEHHAKASEASISRIMLAARCKKVTDLTRRKILAWRDERQGEVSGATVNRDLAALRRFMRWLELRDFILEDPTERIKDLAEEQTRPRRAYRDDELERLWEAMRNLDHIRGGEPQAWVIRGLWSLGCRYGELRQIQWRDVDLEGGLVLLRPETTKGRQGRRKARTIPLTPQVAPGFREAAQAARVAQTGSLGRVVGGSDPVFLSRRGFPLHPARARLLNFLDAAMEMAGVEKIDADGRHLDLHAFRTTFITRLLRQGIGVVQLAKIVGHKDLGMIMRHYEDLGIDHLRQSAGAIDLPKWSPDGASPTVDLGLHPRARFGELGSN
ncbi:MAG: site-specific integrase [Planctomycetes bacterium]|nr:site-specific integrase [Planctomycetota bacterium]MCB9910528.1 site-specific integrase [Planctomycetota bacterium]MCB9912654.1 site-specific integrase [Planctomycetota bacterium]